MARKNGISATRSEISTKERILNATADLLRSSCLHSISIRDIAQASGANSALISYHFGSKEKLYEAIIIQQFNSYKDQVVSQFNAEGNILQNLTSACEAIAAFHLANPNFLVLYFRELTNPSRCYTEVVLPIISESSHKATTMIQAGVDNGIFKPDTNPRYVVQSFISMINYCFMTCSIRKDLNISPTTDQYDYMKFIVEMLVNKIKA